MFLLEIQLAPLSVRFHHGELLNTQQIKKLGDTWIGIIQIFTMLFSTETVCGFTTANLLLKPIDDGNQKKKSPTNSV